MNVSKPPLHACRTCEHGRELIPKGIRQAMPQCEAGHYPHYRYPEHEHDDQHGFYHHCPDHVQRAEIIDADKEDA
jgi:hypothetical protein